MNDKGVCEAMDRHLQYCTIDLLHHPANPVICRECSRRGPTCCRYGVGDNELIAPLSEEEWRRLRTIAPWTSHGGHVARERNSALFIREMQKLFPDHATAVETTFPLGATHLRLAENSLGQCTCLGPQGCLLPSAARPLFCQIYPFWFIDGHLFAVGDPRCLALQTLDSSTTLLEAFGTRHDHLWEIYRQLCRAWGLGSPRPTESAYD